MDTTNNYYKFQHVNGDFAVTVECNAETLEDLMVSIIGFLKGCTFSEGSVRDYIQEF